MLKDLLIDVMFVLSARQDDIPFFTVVAMTLTLLIIVSDSLDICRSQA